MNLKILPTWSNMPWQSVLPCQPFMIILRKEVQPLKCPVLIGRSSGCFMMPITKSPVNLLSFIPKKPPKNYKNCESELNISLEEFISIILKAMQNYSTELDL